MSEPLLTDEMVEVLKTFPGTYASAVSANNRPVLARVIGLGVEDASKDLVRVHLSEQTGAPLLATLAACPRMALVGVQVTSYRTFQFKGDAVATRPASAEDVSEIEDYVQGFGEFAAHVGIDPTRYSPTYTERPWTTVLLRVDKIYDQTPKPGAGALVSERETT